MKALLHFPIRIDARHSQHTKPSLKERREETRQREGALQERTEETARQGKGAAISARGRRSSPRRLVCEPVGGQSRMTPSRARAGACRAVRAMTGY